MPVDLDHLDIRKKIDPDGMLDTAEQFLEQCHDAESIVRRLLPVKVRKFDHLVLCGMGGSAIGGDIVKAYISSQSSIPMEVVRNYSLPGYVNQKTLVITGSYSGNTEETLSCYRAAKSRKSQIVAITTGGKLSALCKRDKTPLIPIPAGYAPRAALGYSMIPLLILLDHWGVIPNQSKHLQAMYGTLRQCIEAYSFQQPVKTNAAKQLARALHGKIPVIYSGQDAFEPVATRWRAQLNENTKSFAHNFVVPEMNHNEILGWKHPQAAVKKLQPVFLIDKGYHQQIRKRFEVMKTVLETSGREIIQIESKGNGLLSRIMSLISLGDFTSIYLAYLYKQDPVPIPAIDLLKQELKK